jgi:hypothetical protein
MMRGGSFDGVFVYDSWASQDPSFLETRFPYVSVNVNIRDSAGSIVNTIDSSPNDFFVTSSFVQLTFGASAGIANSVEDLRLLLTGNFTLDVPPPPPGMSDWGSHAVHIVPPSPSEITAGIFSLGFLETDGSAHLSKYWDLPVQQVSLSHTGTVPYTREVLLVPEYGSTIGFCGLGLLGLVLTRRYLPRSRRHPSPAPREAAWS